MACNGLIWSKHSNIIQNCPDIDIYGLKWPQMGPNILNGSKWSKSSSWYAKPSCYILPKIHKMPNMLSGVTLDPARTGNSGGWVAMVVSW